MVLQLKTKRSAARMIRDDVKQTPGYVQALEQCQPRQGPAQMRSMGVTPREARSVAAILHVQGVHA